MPGRPHRLLQLLGRRPPQLAALGRLATLGAQRRLVGVRWGLGCLVVAFCGPLGAAMRFCFFHFFALYALSRRVRCCSAGSAPCAMIVDGKAWLFRPWQSVTAAVRDFGK